MNDPVWIGVGGLAIAIATSYATSLIQSIKAGRLIERLETAVKDIEGMRSRVEKVPVIENELGHVKAQLEWFKNVLQTVTQKSEVMWLKLFSHDKQIAVTKEKVRQQSRPSIDEEGDTDPPPPIRKR